MQSVEDRRRESKIDYSDGRYCDQIEDRPRTMLHVQQLHNAPMYGEERERAHRDGTQDKYVARNSTAVYYVCDHRSLPGSVPDISGTLGDAIR